MSRGFPGLWVVELIVELVGNVLLLLTGSEWWNWVVGPLGGDLLLLAVEEVLLCRRAWVDADGSALVASAVAPVAVVASEAKASSFLELAAHQVSAKVGSG